MEKDNKNKIYIKDFENKKRNLEKYNRVHKLDKINTNQKKYNFILDKKGIIILLLIVLLIIFIVSIYFILLKKIYKDKYKKLNYSEEQIKNHIEKVEDLKYLNEDKRARKYLKYFINNIKDKKYDEEYFKLYNEYKENFFPSLNDFEIYIKENFPKDPIIKINNFENIGGIFILFVDIIDKDNFENSLKDMKFVYKEEDLNHYVFSFSIKNKNEKGNTDYVTPPDEIEFERDEENRNTGESFNLIEEMIKQDAEKNSKESKKQENKR